MDARFGFRGACFFDHFFNPLVFNMVSLFAVVSWFVVGMLFTMVMWFVNGSIFVVSTLRSAIPIHLPYNKALQIHFPKHKP